MKNIYIFVFLEEQIPKNSQHTNLISTFLTGKEIKDLMELIGPHVEGNRLEMIYQASVDGRKVIDFHTCCDKIERTLLVVKSTTNRIFGGYTHLGWDSTSFHKLDPRAFLFSLTNKFGMPRIIKPKDKNKQ